MKKIFTFILTLSYAAHLCAMQDSIETEIINTTGKRLYLQIINDEKLITIEPDERANVTANQAIQLIIRCGNKTFLTTLDAFSDQVVTIGQDELFDRLTINYPNNKIYLDTCETITITNRTQHPLHVTACNDLGHSLHIPSGKTRLYLGTSEIPFCLMYQGKTFEAIAFESEQYTQIAIENVPELGNGNHFLALIATQRRCKNPDVKMLLYPGPVGLS